MGCTSWQETTDEYRSRHRVWRLAEPEAMAQIADAMRHKKLVIADGHHRYETALAYRDLARAQGCHEGQAEYVMMTFVRVETPGLTILPTHRIVHGLPDFDAQAFQRETERYFSWEEIPEQEAGGGQVRRFMAILQEAGREVQTFGAYLSLGRFVLLRRRPEVSLETLLPQLAPSLRGLDVIVLHQVLLEKVLGISPLAVKEEKNLRYVRDAAQTVQQVDGNQAQVSFLLNPTPAPAVLENALAGLVMPQKSTDFFPKLLSGLTVYNLDDPAVW